MPVVQGVDVPYEEPLPACTNCGSFIRWEVDRRSSNGLQGCRQCLNEITCSICDEICQHYRYDRRNYFCLTCFDTTLPLLRYDQACDNSIIEIKTDKDVTYGWELEIGIPNCTWRACNKVLADIGKDLLSLKQDGSITRSRDPLPISNCLGFEIVTRPFYWEWWQTNKPKFYDAFKELVKLGALSHKMGTCGFHIHIGGLTKPQRAAVLHLTLNDPMLPLLLSRRNNTAYCNFQTMSYRKLLDYSNAGARGEMSRYLAAHHTKHSTVELRYFKGTLNAVTFQALLEFTNALVSFVQAKSAEGETLNNEQLLTYIVKENTWPSLITYLRQREAV